MYRVSREGRRATGSSDPDTPPRLSKKTIPSHIPAASYPSTTIAGRWTWLSGGHPWVRLGCNAAALLLLLLLVRREQDNLAVRVQVERPSSRILQRLTDGATMHHSMCATEKPAAAGGSPTGPDFDEQLSLLRRQLDDERSLREKVEDEVEDMRVKERARAGLPGLDSEGKAGGVDADIDPGVFQGLSHGDIFNTAPCGEAAHRVPGETNAEGVVWTVEDINKLEEERDALRAQVASLEEQLQERRMMQARHQQSKPAVDSQGLGARTGSRDQTSKNTGARGGVESLTKGSTPFLFGQQNHARVEEPRAQVRGAGGGSDGHAAALASEGKIGSVPGAGKQEQDVEHPEAVAPDPPATLEVDGDSSDGGDGTKADDDPLAAIARADVQDLDFEVKEGRPADPVEDVATAPEDGAEDRGDHEPPKKNLRGSSNHPAGVEKGAVDTVSLKPAEDKENFEWPLDVAEPFGKADEPSEEPEYDGEASDNKELAEEISSSEDGDGNGDNVATDGGSGVDQATELDEGDQAAVDAHADEPSATDKAEAQAKSMDENTERGDDGDKIEEEASVGAPVFAYQQDLEKEIPARGGTLAKVAAEQAPGRAPPRSAPTTFVETERDPRQTEAVLADAEAGSHEAGGNGKGSEVGDAREAGDAKGDQNDEPRDVGEPVDGNGNSNRKPVVSDEANAESDLADLPAAEPGAALPHVVGSDGKGANDDGKPRASAPVAQNEDSERDRAAASKEGSADGDNEGASPEEVEAKLEAMQEEESDVDDQTVDSTSEEAHEPRQQQKPAAGRPAQKPAQERFQEPATQLAQKLALPPSLKVTASTNDDDLTIGGRAKPQAAALARQEKQANVEDTDDEDDREGAARPARSSHEPANDGEAHSSTDTDTDTAGRGHQAGGSGDVSGASRQVDDSDDESHARVPAGDRQASAGATDDGDDDSSGRNKWARSEVGRYPDARAQQESDDESETTVDDEVLFQRGKREEPWRAFVSDEVSKKRDEETKKFLRLES